MITPTAEAMEAAKVIIEIGPNIRDVITTVVVCTMFAIIGLALFHG